MSITMERSSVTISAQRVVFEKLVEVLGREYVHNSEESRQRHSMDTHPFSKTCAFVVHPSTAAEVQKIMRIATAYQWPVWPFSRGNNWGYGTKNALESNAIIVILDRMNRIIEVNEKLAYAVIEPGVTQKQLNDYLKEKGIQLWIDCTDSTPNGSLVGNAIERGYGYTPYGDHFGQICGLEAVLPNGDLVQTGGEHAKAKTWHTLKWGSGPYIEGLFSQSNFGIVVKTGLWLMPKPEQFELFNFEISSDEQLPHVIDALRTLALEGVVLSHTHMANVFQMLSLLGPYPYELRGNQTYLSEETIMGLRKKYHLPAWSLVGGLYGSKESIHVSKKRIAKRLKPLGALEFFNESKISIARRFIRLHENGLTSSFSRFIASLLKPMISPKPMTLIQLMPEIFEILKGNPNEGILASAYFKSKKRPPKENLNPAEDECGIIWVTPAVPSLGSEAVSILNTVKPIYKKHGFEFSGCFTRMNPRTFFFLLGIFFNHADADEKKRALALYQELLEATKKAGFVQYRLGLGSMKSFMQESPETGRFLLKIKESIDPANILSPGKYNQKKGENL